MIYFWEKMRNILPLFYLPSQEGIKTSEEKRYIAMLDGRHFLAYEFIKEKKRVNGVETDRFVKEIIMTKVCSNQTYLDLRASSDYLCR